MERQRGLAAASRRASGELFARIRSTPRIDRSDGSWRVRAYQGLNGTFDRDWFEQGEEAPREAWPVYKGESFNLWEPDTGVYYGSAIPSKLLPELFRRRLAASQNSKSPFSELERAVINNPDSLSCVNPTLVFRDITNQSNRRTVIAALLPPRVFTVNTAPYLLWPRGDEKDQAFLLGVLSSLPLDWYARCFIEKHLNFHIFYSLPVPRPPRTSDRWKRAAMLAGRLACPDRRFKTWAEAVGVEWGALKPAVKDNLIAELDAVVAHLYGLSEAQLRHTFETFHEGWDYGPRLAAVLEHYRAWEGKE